MCGSVCMQVIFKIPSSPHGTLGENIPLHSMDVFLTERDFVGIEYMFEIDNFIRSVSFHLFDLKPWPFSSLSASSPPRHLFVQGCSFKGKTETLAHS